MLLKKLTPLRHNKGQTGTYISHMSTKAQRAQSMCAKCSTSALIYTFKNLRSIGKQKSNFFPVYPSHLLFFFPSLQPPFSLVSCGPSSDRFSWTCQGCPVSCLS